MYLVVFIIIVSLIIILPFSIWFVIAYCLHERDKTVEIELSRIS